MRLRLGVAVGGWTLVCALGCPVNNVTEDAGAGNGGPGNAGRDAGWLVGLDAGGSWGSSSGSTGTSGGNGGASSGGNNGSNGSSGTSGSANGSSGSNNNGSSSGGTVPNGCALAEICDDGLDNNCNGRVDENCVCTDGDTQDCFSGDPARAGVGICTLGTQTCVNQGEAGEWSECVGSVKPADVVCGSGVDYACVGDPNHGCTCIPGESRPCYSGPTGTAGNGQCQAGSQLCENGVNGPYWGFCDGEVLPAQETCDGEDHDCDGTPDTGCGCTIGLTEACYSGRPDTLNVGLCMGGMRTCMATANGSAFGPCDGEVTPLPDACDGVDRDCDNNPNTGCACVVGTSEPCYDGPSGTEGVGTCHAGTHSCALVGGVATWGACGNQVLPAPMQACDGTDRMCNNDLGQGCACQPGTSEACYSGPTGTAGVGICHAGTRACTTVGGTLGWGPCTNEVTPAASDTCGNNADDNCNGPVDEGCAAIACPANQTVNAGTAAVLTATGTGLSGYSWRVVTQPSGAGSSAVWSPAPPTQASVQFLPYIVGVYTLEASARDAQNQVHTCQTLVTAQAHGLRVELTWNGSGDVDLHLHNGTNTPWFDSSGSQNDCYYSDCVTTPVAWGASLDVDNVTANGPENVNVDTPNLNENYAVAAHNYTGASGRVATVKIFCGLTQGGITPTATYTSRALAGTTSGNCTANDFWRVATVRFTAPGVCTVTPLNTYTPSTDACANR